MIDLRKYLIDPNKVTTNILGGKAKQLSSFRDTDRDGVPNFSDCQPFNSKRQGWIHDFFGRKAPPRKYALPPTREKDVREVIRAEQEKRAREEYWKTIGKEKVRKSKKIARDIALGKPRPQRQPLFGWQQTPIIKEGKIKGIERMSALPSQQVEGNGLRKMSSLGTGGGFSQMVGLGSVGNGDKGSLLLGKKRKNGR